MKRENFYRRNPSKALSGMIGLTLEERGVYNTIIDLLYSTWLPLEDDRAFIAGWCGCAVQKLNPIIRRLIERERLITFTEGNRTYLSDAAFEDERKDVKGPTKTRSGRANVGEKSGEVGEKSEGVDQNHGLLHGEGEEKQGDRSLDKSREEKTREEADASSGEGDEGVRGKVRKRRPETAIPAGYPDASAIADGQQRIRDAGANLDAGVQAERFKNHAEQNDRRARDWAAAWRNWVIGAIDKAPKSAVATPLFSGVGSAPAVAAIFDGPPALRAGVVKRVGEAFAVKYIDQCRWDPETRTLLAKTGFAADEIRRELRGWLLEKEIRVDVAGQPALAGAAA
jgi:hypothetical protein